MVLGPRKKKAPIKGAQSYYCYWLCSLFLKGFKRCLVIGGNL